MNKVIVMLSVILFILVACDNNDTGLEGKELGISTLDPTVSEDRKENSTIKFSSGMLVFDFASNDEVKLIYNGDEYTGNYTLDNKKLVINLKDKEDNLTIKYSDFEKVTDEYYSYIGKIEDAALENNSKKTQLSNIINHLGGMGETYIFLEE